MNKYAVMPLSHYQNVCTAIREKTSDPELITSAEMLNKISAVYSAGYDKGKSEGGGGSTDYFFEIYQEGGKRQNYSDAFAGYGWTNTTFKPKYDITPTNGYRLFADSKISGDLVEILEDLGVSLDTSQSTDMQYAFAISEFTHLGTISFNRASAFYNVFRASSKLVTIDELIFKNDGSNTFNTAFMGCSSLANIRKITGVIGGGTGNKFELQYSPLTVESMKNVIMALKNHSGTSLAGKVTLTFSSGCWAALEADSTAPDGNTWQEYVNNLGWLT